MFLKIGERINSSRKAIAQALEKKDEAFIRQEAKLQKEAGALILDVNCAFNSKNEVSDMEWLVKIVQEETGCSLSIDSPNAEVIEVRIVHKGGAASGGPSQHAGLLQLLARLTELLVGLLQPRIQVLDPRFLLTQLSRQILSRT